MTTARPILMSAPMVRSTIKGIKTQTRRCVSPDNIRFLRGGINEPIVKYRPAQQCLDEALSDPRNMRFIDNLLTWDCPDSAYVLAEPKYQVGDLLYVRETWAITDNVAGCDTPWPDRPHIKLTPDLVDRAVIWAADGHWNWSDGDGFSSDRSFWKPSIHMPRKFSRLTLELTDVRVERLQDISEEDAIAEGISKLANGQWHWLGSSADPGQHGYHTPTGAYDVLWGDINGLASWPSNPWVWVLAFKVHHANVDAVLAQRAEVAA